MFAINHAATALLLKKSYDTVHIAWALISVQLIELIWVTLNYLGIEQTITEEQVRSVSDIHLAFMPYSHSFASTILLAGLAFVVLRFGFRRAKVAYVVALGILSHIALDFLVHAPDLALAPSLDSAPKLGTGLYHTMPILAFIIELCYGLICWWVYRGSWGLFAVITLFNLANLTLFLPQVVGLEGLLAGRPNLIVSLILGQIIVTLLLVGLLSKRRAVPAKEI